MDVLSATQTSPSFRTRLSTKGGKDVFKAAFFWLTAFFFVYCARPEDWIPGLRYLPLGKITGLCALIGFLSSLSRSKKRLSDLPMEARYLLAIMGVMLLSGFLSPVWRGGAVLKSIDFSKVYLAWVLILLVVDNLDKLRRLIYIQAASVALICAVSIIKGGHRPRLEGVLGGIYSNANDLAFAIVLSMPFCLAFLISAKGMFRKLLWLGGILIMLGALFLTASRAGFIDLMITGVVCLWHFGVKGKRLYLIITAALVITVLGSTMGGKLYDRFAAISGDTETEQSAYGSYQLRTAMIEAAINAIERYPILGLGMNNLVSYGGHWTEVHMTYLQMGAEGGIPALILYLLFFACGFRNLRQLRRMPDLEGELKLFSGAMHSSLVGFAVGACFGPEAYHFFPYFAVAYSAALLAIAKDREAAAVPDKKSLLRGPSNLNLYGTRTRPDAIAVK